jgi:rhodanese-related sulfurtransferase
LSNFIVSITLPFLLFGFFDIDWESVDDKITNDFPNVEIISTDKLHKLYLKESSSLPLIIDVRTENEFKVSHLANALNLETTKEISQLASDKETNIVVYCSVGYRSAAIADELIKLGYKNVRNLHHSIFEWASKDYPLSNKYGDTDKVHPFNKKWGKLLDDSLHEYSFGKP